MSASTSDSVFHVAPWGNDNWSGQVVEASEDDGPWATLPGARDALRKRRRDGAYPKSGATVWIHEGLYELAERLIFEEEDSGEEAAPLRFVAAPGAAPIISGGQRIEGWREIQHKGLRCWVADLPDVASGDWKFTRLFVNGHPRQRPRLPKKGFTHFTGIAGYPDMGYQWNQGPDRAEFALGDIQEWHNWQDAELVTYQLWFETRHRFKQIDKAAGVVHFESRSLGSLVDEASLFARYFVENIFEALDTPGEWYLDRIAGRLYYLPLEKESLKSTEVVAPKLTEILRLQGGESGPVRHLHFEELTFAFQHWELPVGCSGYVQAAFGVPGSLVLDGADRCVFYRCRVAHINGYGIEVLRGSTANTFAACTVHDAGAGGIKIGHENLHIHNPAGGENMEGEFSPIETTVVDCTIRDCGHLFPSAIGIWVGNSGWNRILHNEVFDCNYTGISCGWQWGYAPAETIANRIEFNHVHHINQHKVLSDNGGIYTLGVQPGTTLIGNRIHDISCYHYGGWGIYPDEGSSEIRFERNLVSGTIKGAYMNNYGRDNLVQNNIFAFSEERHLKIGKREKHRSCLFRRNAVIALNDRIFPNYLDLLKLPAHYTMQDNLFWSIDSSPFKSSRHSLDAHQGLGQKTGAMVADPLFADPEGGDFSLRPDSPLFETGFKTFDWKAAGPRLELEVPPSYREYLTHFPLPSTDIPVIQTRIEVDTGRRSLVAQNITFQVKVKNLGRSEGRGNLLLMTGPVEKTEIVGDHSMEYALAPGEEISMPVNVRIREESEQIWLETEPQDGLAIPCRRILFDQAMEFWMIPGGWDQPEVGSLAEALCDLPQRLIARDGRTVAGVRMASSGESLLFHAEFFETKLQPNLKQPSSGTAMEISTIVNGPKRIDEPGYQKPRKHFVALVPSASAKSLDAVCQTSEQDQPTPTQEVCTAISPIPNGYSLSAIIPWKSLGQEIPPNQIGFEMVANVVDRENGGILRVEAFDLPFNGRMALDSHLVITPNPI